MPANLFEQISGYLASDVISKAGSFLHESPAGTSMAMASAVPALLGSITNMAGAPGGAAQLSGLLSSGNYDGSILNNLSHLFGGGTATTAAIQQGQGLLSTFFGDKINAVTSAISGYSGIGKNSAASLLALAAPLVMGVLGRLRSAQGLNPGGLASLLMSQKPAIASMIPASLRGITDGIDLQGLESVPVTPMAEERSGLARWWPLLLLLLGLIALLAWLFWRGKPDGATIAALEQVKLCSGGSTPLLTRPLNRPWPT